MGGAQRCLVDLLPAVEERGWKARAAIPAGGPLVELLRDRGIQVDEIQCGPYGCGKKSVADRLQFALDVPRQVSAIAALMKHADLIYVNGPRLLIAAALASKGRVPLVFHAHHRIEERSARYLQGLALRRSGAIVAACCDAVAQPLRRWVRDVQVVPNGTADLGFLERTFESRREWRIGVIGRIAPEKGQAEFLRAAAVLAQRGLPARFVICGAPLFGDRKYYNDVLRLAAGLPVEFLDWQDDIGSVLRDLDILAIPSKQEGMPRVLLEAFSAGVPAVAFPVGGIPEVIEDRVTGFVARGALAAAIENVMVSDPERVRAVARRARREWERRYTIAAYREQITNLMAQSVPPVALETAAPQPRRSATLQ